MFFEVISEMETGIEFRKANRDSLREYRKLDRFSAGRISTANPAIGHCALGAVHGHPLLDLVVAAGVKVGVGAVV